MGVLKGMTKDIFVLSLTLGNILELGNIAERQRAVIYQQVLLIVKLNWIKV